MKKKIVKPKTRTVIGENYWALLCNCGYDAFKTAMVCGVVSTYDEAKALAKTVKDCPCKHKIVQVPEVTVKFCIPNAKPYHRVK